MKKLVTKPSTKRRPCSAPSAPAPSPKPDPAKRPAGKLGAILQQLEKKTGATIEELATSLGCQNHSVRAALSRLWASGHALSLETRGNRRAYRLAT